MAEPIIVISPIRPGEEGVVRDLVLSTIREDGLYDYNPCWHWDLDELATTYMGRSLMMVVRVNGEIIGCGGLRTGAPIHLPDRYTPGDPAVMQLVRIAVRKDWRRKGLAKALVETLIPIAVADEDTRVLCLHASDKGNSPIPFWLAMGARVIKDERDEDPTWRTVHFEYDLDALRNPEVQGADRIEDDAALGLVPISSFWPVI